MTMRLGTDHTKGDLLSPWNSEALLYFMFQTFLLRNNTIQLIALFPGKPKHVFTIKLSEHTHPPPDDSAD